MVFLIKIIYEVCVLRDALQMKWCRFTQSTSLYVLFQKLIHTYEWEIDPKDEKISSRGGAKIHFFCPINKTCVAVNESGV